jgi:hypothetical protein
MDLTSTTSRFERIYQHLIVADVKKQLGSLFVPDKVSDTDAAYALSVASRLALCSDGRTESAAIAARKAYEVGIRSLGLGNGSAAQFREATDLILSRLGNFPARELLRSRANNGGNQSTVTLSLEILAREFENRVSSGERQTYLTDFQVRLLKALETKTYVSVSAPTSAGKSFTLELEILRQLKSNRQLCVVYLVPTRALIRQVTFDLVQILRDGELTDVQVLSVPSVPQQPSVNRRAIYVLTQERFANLLMTDESELGIDALIVDEAQEISEMERGQTLESVIERTLHRYPRVKVFFSSPLKSNPEYLLSLFARTDSAESFVEYLTPVTQNVINIYPLKGHGNTNKARFEIWLDGTAIDIGTVELPFKFRRPHMHTLASHLTQPGETSIIYCNDPSSADKSARNLADTLDEAEERNESLEELSDFLRGHVHPQYRLADLLYKGVAFHYGNIPQIIRGRVEELLRERSLRFVCCTSTLLQGMNLPAKNIFVEDPKKGRGRPMSTGDFWNLVGRAGRMAKEFNGNVYCVHGKDWQTKPLGGHRMDAITSAFASALNEKVKSLAEVAVSPPSASESDLAWAEQAFARIYSNFTRTGQSIADSQFATSNNREALKSVDDAIARFQTRKTLPNQLYIDNIYIHPARLEDLADQFRSSGSVTKWIPPNPNARGSYEGLLPAFQLLEMVFFRTGFKTYKYDTFLALQWMQGLSLKALIENKIRRNEASGDIDRVNELIRELFDELENRLRFKYVKYMKVYADVLRAILVQEHREADLESIPPIHLFLEYGASSLTLINLIALGLSRTSAILLTEMRGLGDDLTISQCERFMETVDLGAAEIPAICRSEISRLRRTAQS